ncbi:MAG: nucleotidyltransferase domain-containing protein [Candidatus Atribacteria bacterium]|nr:nucleotidyltransferase domain-containing protein [Candidatus Atribacteria bacterium]
MVEKRNKQSIVSPDFHNREKLLNQELSRYLRLLTKHGAPEKVILFGTLAEGRIHEWSDIDLVVIERTTLPFYQRLRKIRKLLQPEVGMDILIYTPDKFDQLCTERPFFREEIIAKGKVIYEHSK